MFRASCIALFFFIFLISCSSAPKNSDPKKPLLLVSLPPYQTLAEKIGGDFFEVATVVPANADPHTYEPTSRQTSKMSGSKIWFQVGEPFETKLKPILSQAAQVDLRDHLDMIESHEGCHHSCSHDHQDRHIWLSPAQMKVQAKTIGAALIREFPEQKQGIVERLAVVEQELETLDAQLKAQLKSVEGKALLVSHPAFGYFCRDYHLTQISIEQEGKEPRPKELEAILDQAQQQNVRLSIAIPQHHNKGVHLVAKNLHVPVQTIDPYAADFEQTMRTLAMLIVDAENK